MSPDRNSPCPCGSGRKYKRCCLRRDADSSRALRLIGADPGPKRERSANGRFPAGTVWQADIVPIAATFEDDPGARPAVALVMGNGFVLHTDILSSGPSEPTDVAAAIASAVEQSRAAAVDAPRVIEVRFRSVGEALARILGPEIDVRVLPRLDEVDDAASSLNASAIGGDGDPRLQASTPATWRAWGLGDDRLRRLFEAAASYHRASPWKHANDDETIEARVRGGGTWYLAVLGGAGETFGIAAYASLDDLDALFASADGAEHAHFMRLTDAVVSLTFVPSSHLPRPTRQEIRSARWEVAGEFAYPMLMVLNTPGGGITSRQADDLIEILRALPSFLMSESANVDQPAEAAVQFSRVRVGDESPLWPEPAELAPALSSGAGADPSAVIGVGADEVATLRSQEPLFDRYSEWLARPVKGKVPADSTITRHMRPARELAEFMAYAHGVPVRAISELDLRVFLYDHALSRGVFGEVALDHLRGSLRRFFTFLASVEQIDCPWAQSILDDASTFAYRRLDWFDVMPHGDVQGWRAELTQDLGARMLIPESETPDGTSWLPLFTRETLELFRELMRRWLVWRDEAIASGVTEPDAVRAVAMAKQIEWQNAVHPALGISPAAALARDNVRGDRPRT